MGQRPYAVSTIALKAGPGAWAAHHPYPQRTPVLRLVFPGLQVLVSTTSGDQVTRADLDFAACLAEQAAAFAAALEQQFNERASA
ncbi:hypothetical protein [Acrocarpospora catenulata]|uniref:hypothetical protein n=1 Tax=Acrocarpospora catenulata TaxID=2836182 RepID=UPI001BDB5039|nr:hypothetical protein [Acrocarpospora catenulata]